MQARRKSRGNTHFPATVTTDKATWKSSRAGSKQTKQLTSSTNIRWVHKSIIIKKLLLVSDGKKDSCLIKKVLLLSNKKAFTFVDKFHLFMLGSDSGCELAHPGQYQGKPPDSSALFIQLQKNSHSSQIRTFFLVSLTLWVSWRVFWKLKKTDS